MDGPNTQGAFRFGDFELDALRRRLVDRTTSTPVPVTAKIFDTLLYLVERPGRLVEKRELMEALWPNVVVEEGNLTQTIHTLRRALGERAGEQRYIVTVPGRGYRFVAEVDRADRPGGAAPAASARRSGAGLRAAILALGALLVIAALSWWRMERPVVALPAAQSPSLAVLPFVDLSPDADQAWFADGLAEEILNLLARIPGLRVIARTSSFSFRDTSVDVRQVHERLAVTHVLEGSVRKDGDRVRVTAQLIDARTSAHLWSATYDRKLRDVLDVQAAIAAAITEALGVQFSDSRRLVAQGETTDPQAREHYLLGQYFLNRRQASDVALARASFEAATRLDPRYSRAWSGLAATWHIEANDRQLTPAEAQRWHEAAVRAIESGPELAEAHARSAHYLFWSGQIRQAQHHMSEARKLQPHDRLALAGQMSEASVAGRLAEAAALATQIVANDPVSAVDRSVLGTMLLATGRHREAAVELRKAVELGLVSADNQNFLCKALLLDGRRDEALAAIEGERGPQAEQCIALVHLARGELAQASEILSHLAAGAEAQPEDWAQLLAIAELQAGMGRIDAAFDSLQSAAASAKISGSAYYSARFVAELQLSPYLAALHSDPRWGALLAARRAAWERQG